MANWQGVQEGLVSGFQIGRTTGGKLSGLGSVIGKVADRLKQQRETGEAMGQKQQILGMEEASKIRLAEKQHELETSPRALEFEKAKAGLKPGKTLIGPMITKISANEDAYYNLGAAAEALKVNKDKFSQFLGPAKQILRNPVRSYVNKDLQDFLAWKANVQDAFQQYRVAITGAQASDKEIALLAKNRPTENDTYEVFTKKTNEVRKIGNQVITRYITNLKKAGYNTSGYEEDLSNLNAELGNFSGDNLPTNTGQDIVTIQDITGEIRQMPRQEAINKGYING